MGRFLEVMMRCAAGGLMLAGIAGCQQASNAASAAQAAPQEAKAAVQNVEQTAKAAAQSAVQNAVAAIQGVPLALDQVPQNVLNLLQQTQSTQTSGNWGQPQTIYVNKDDQRYVFVFAPAPNGQPRVIIVNAMSPVARLERLQKQGY